MSGRGRDQEKAAGTGIRHRPATAQAASSIAVM